MEGKEQPSRRLMCCGMLSGPVSAENSKDSDEEIARGRTAEETSSWSV